MAQSKLSFLLVVLILLIAASAFTARLEAQKMSTEEKRATVQEFVKQAQEFVQENKIAEAIDLYERITKAVPENFESRAELAKLYTRTNQHEKAAQTWRKLLEAAPENTAYQDALVNSLQAADKVDEAIELVQSYIQTHPEVGSHYARLAKLYADEDNVDAAITNYEKAIELAYGDSQTYVKLARLYFFNEDIDASEFALKNAILSTTSSREQKNLERQLLNLYRYYGNLEEKLQKAEDVGTITFEMQKAHAEYYHKTGQLEKAANAYKRAHDMTAGSSEKDRIYSELFKVYIQLGDMDSVLEPYETEANAYINSKAGVLHIGKSYNDFGKNCGDIQI